MTGPCLSTADPCASFAAPLCEGQWQVMRRKYNALLLEQHKGPSRWWSTLDPWRRRTGPPCQWTSVAWTRCCRVGPMTCWAGGGLVADCFGLRFTRCRRFPAGLCVDLCFMSDAMRYRLLSEGYRCRWARVRLRAVACADPSPW